MNASRIVAHRSVLALLLAALASWGCADSEASERAELGELFAVESSDYCALPEHRGEVLLSRPGPDEAPIDDVNWFARPVPHAGDDWILGFASHDQNWLYNLTQGVRVRIPDRSDAVATPDGRYMTVPSTYTPDSNVRFYAMGPLLAALEAGRDAADQEPAFVHEHPSMKRVYYQSTGVLAEQRAQEGLVVDYRLMFSGGHDSTGFRIVDYRFTHDPETGALRSAEASAPMALCPEVRNDLNTPFISKDGRWVAAYTSEEAGNAYTPGASLKIFEITSTDPAGGTTTCRPAVDFGFAAGKADFSFDGSMLTFHISQGGYLTPFVNGGLPATTITDVVVADLQRDGAGRIVGHGRLRRLTTSLEAGVGSYFPAFFPDGTLFWVANSVPKESEADKRFHFRVMDPRGGGPEVAVFENEATRAAWLEIEALWERSCRPANPMLAEPPFPLEEHEAPWIALSLTRPQCLALIADARTEAAGSDSTEWDRLGALCGTLGS